MKLSDVKNKIAEIKKGTFLHIEYMKEEQKGEHLLVKESSGVYRIGINYANLKTQKNKVTGPLAWGEWVKCYENYLLSHTKKGETEENFYLRIYTTDSVKTVSRYFLDGVERTKQWLIDNGFIKVKKSERLDCFCVNVKNITKIGTAE